MLLHERQALFLGLVVAEHVSLCTVAVVLVGMLHSDVLTVIILGKILLLSNFEIVLRPECFFRENDIFLLGQAQKLGINGSIKDYFVQRLQFLSLVLRECEATAVDGGFPICIQQLVTACAEVLHENACGVDGLEIWQCEWVNSTFTLAGLA